ncbi:fungal-specific transcription factor domain-containing protein [Hypoxylon argillaceum]|nr:fungal-specific transcription factor domain-containing protein [Hypoxylon argillaceum]
MDTEASAAWTPKSTHRSSSGCWTCRLRRKKCNEQHPVKEKGHRRIGNHNQNDNTGFAQVTTDARMTLSQRPGPTLPALNALTTTPATHGEGIRSPVSQALNVGSQRRANCKFAPNMPRRNSTSAQPDDSILIIFYIEQVFPFLFPFYQPPLLQGGRAWVLDMVMNSPVVRQAALCQSSYFLTLSRGAADDGGPLWEAVLAQTREVFSVLRQALQVISSSNITEHLHGAVRVLSAIIQVQRFDLAVSSFGNCQSHLNGALALFKQLLDSAGSFDLSRFKSSFEAVIYNLGPPSWSSALHSQLPSPEQAAFRFSSTLLIFDDIIASTVLKEQPRLYEFHHSLLEGIQDTGPIIDLEVVIGCQNWVLVQIAEIAVLDTWKQRCKNSGTLDMMELVHRATAIKSSLETDLARIQIGTGANLKENNDLFDVLAVNNTAGRQKPLITLAWAHAALIYLSIVVSGWQPANPEIRYRVRHIIETPVREMFPPALLRTMVWPLCVAGCLAEPELATQLCGTVETLQPRSVFGTLTKALEVMKNMWRDNNSEGIVNCDLASCFQTQGDLVLLV